MWDHLPASTTLDERGPCFLSRSVVHRFVGHNALKTLRRERFNIAVREKELPPPILQPVPHPSLQLDGLRMHWNSDPLLPDVTLAIPAGEKPPLIASSGSDLVQEGFRILLCPLEGPFNPQFQVLGGGRRFRAKGADSIAGADNLQGALARVISAARELGLHLIIFPELMVCQSTRRHLVNLLNEDELDACPYGVVAGSFHVWRGACDGRNAYVANESLLLDHLGQPLLRHDKRGRFAVPPKVAQGPNKFFPDPVTIPADVTQVVEDIEHEEGIQFLETSLGRIAMAICADCIVPNATSLIPALERAQPELLLIAAMTSETERFEKAMALLAEGGTTSIFVNAHCICPSEDSAPPRDGGAARRKESQRREPPLLAAAQFALFEPSGAPPTRIRWQVDAPEPEVCYLRPKDSNKAWRPISKAPKDCGVTPFHIEGKVAGLVVELGAYARWRPSSGKGTGLPATAHRG